MSTESGAGWSVGEVAARFGLAVSTLHWWEKCGLLAPERASGRRVYREAELRRIAVVQLLQGTAGMALPEIAALLEGSTGDRDWRAVVRGRVARCEEQLDQVRRARDYLTHLLECPSEHPVAQCPYLAADIDSRLPAP
ncbi:MerR family transcriptional regulator [Streptomyces boncukensis]|uniref:MerR family transcriptional regulator n=1 Tax=Streptomyces boncukensis TaxID=2711219 RepID=A0A6G4WW15_9ACTN|nr:MerR family transcriptional regulator [Streptomyces boncukensis]NGO69476.1 MerR family transcriptional regulator [Streptomyces boncukensis]